MQGTDVLMEATQPTKTIKIINSVFIKDRDSKANPSYVRRSPKIRMLMVLSRAQTDRLVAMYSATIVDGMDITSLNVLHLVRTGVVCTNFIVSLSTKFTWEAYP